jgi:class 3 adenylate cyclase
MNVTTDRPRIAVVGAADATALSSIGDVVTFAEDALLPPDLVIVDGTRPDLGAFCRDMRERSDATWFPILVVSADGDGIAALDAGADGVIAPTARSEEVVARARALLRLKARHDEVEAQATRFTDWTRTLVTQVAEQVEELQRVERLRRFLSPQVADVVAGDERLLESHRREIAVVFCDLRGFTAFSETAEPEEVMSVLREYHAVLGALVFQFEATLERFAGDAILAFFNDPVPCPDPAARAVRMAVAMREQVRELATKWRKRGHELDFGVGIAVGHATLGRIGFEGRFDYGAVGSVVNLAARLCAEALGGQILLSERAYSLVEELVDADPLLPVQLKGFQRPVNIHHVAGLRAAPEPAS